MAECAISTVAMSPEHAQAVLRIYQEGLDSGQASFETRAPQWPQWDEGHLAAHRFVAVGDDGAVLGWVALSAVSGRCVYAGVAEVSVYVRATARGRGVGSVLLRRAIASSEAGGIWTLQAGIFPENEPSIALHERCGFRVVGRRERIGRHDGVGAGRWRDVVLLERRSDEVG
jgi:phosphinothricin acetyltransferase